MGDANRIPAVCNDCGEVFPSGFEMDASSAMFEGNTSGPCPRCGGTGTIPDGLYEAVGRVLELAPQVGATREDLLRLRALIESDATFDVDVLSARAKQEAPTAAPLLAVLRDPALSNIVGLLALLVGIAALLVSMQAG